MKRCFKDAFLRTLPVMAGYLVLGIGFGLVANDKGYGFWWVLAMSVLVYAGSMQFVAVSLLTGGANLIAVALTTLMVNARHLFYGISMVDRYKGAGAKKPYLIFALTDETYSLVCDDDALPENVDRHKYYLTVSLLNQCYWVTGSILGVLVGTLIPFNTTGVEFAMTALFITVFVEQWKTAKNHLPAIIGVVISVASLLIFGAGNFLIPAMLGIAVLLLIFRRPFSRKEAADRA